MSLIHGDGGRYGNLDDLDNFDDLEDMDDLDDMEGLDDLEGDFPYIRRGSN